MPSSGEIALHLFIQLAIVFAAVGKSPLVGGLAIGGGVACALFQIGIGRRLRRAIASDAERQPRPAAGALAIVAMLVLAYAAFTDGLGIHSIFGTFVAGAVIPRGRLVDDTLPSVEPLMTVLLVPPIFVTSGLNTRVALLTAPICSAPPP